MKKFLFLTLLLSFGILSAQNAALKGKDISLSMADGRLVLADGKGNPLLFLGKLKLTWQSPYFSPKKIGTISPDQLEVRYKTELAGTDSAMKLKAEFTLVQSNRLKVEFSILNPSVNTKLGGCMLEMALPKNTKKLARAYKSGVWTRDRNGGIPYEVADGAYRLFQTKNADLWLKHPGNVNFQNAHSEHIAFSKNESGIETARMEFLILPSNTSPAEMAALLNERPAALEFTTTKDFNLWKTGKPEFKLGVYNTSGKESTLPLTVTVRDFDGKTVLKKEDNVKLASSASKIFSFSIPEEKRGIYFAEASCKVDGKEIFTRTNLTILPDHTYASPETSKLGMAAFFPIPSEDVVYRLMKRIGVRYLRNADHKKTYPKYGLIAFAHSNVDPKGDLDALKGKATEMLDKFIPQENPAWEFCNEWNMKKNREDKIKSAEKYSELVRYVADVKQKKNAKMALLSMGIAGADTFYLEQFKKNGIWDMLDGIVIHPGRGSFTPDYDNQNEAWCYLGAIRKVKNFVAKNGAKPIYLSEVYTATPPNSRWNDSYREATDNVLLTLAIGVAEGVEVIEYYQMHDSVWFNQGGVNHKNSEYHYGLLLRDGAAKPSLLAFATASEALDGAKFVKYVTLPGTKTHAIEFSTPRGPMAVVYDRTDGYLQAKLNSKQFEPWLDHWKSKTKAVFSCDRKEVTVIDVIGRAKTVPTVNGKVELTLTGSPQIVYGLKF